MASLYGGLIHAIRLQPAAGRSDDRRHAGPPATRPDDRTADRRAHRPAAVSHRLGGGRGGAGRGRITAPGGGGAAALPRNPPPPPRRGHRGGRGLRGKNPAALGRCGTGRGRALQAGKTGRRGAGRTVRLQLRFHRLHAPAARLVEPRAGPALRQPRIHQRRADAARHRRRPRGVGQGGRLPGCPGDGGARPFGGRDREGRRGLASGGKPGAQPPHHRQHADAPVGAGGRPCAAAHQGLARRAHGPGHAQQLLGRSDPVGHGADRRGKFSLLFRRQAEEKHGICHRARELQTLRHPWPALLRLAPVRQALRCRVRTGRDEPLRLDRRVRPLRSALGAGQAYGSRPFQARNRHRRPQSRRAHRGLFGRR